MGIGTRLCRLGAVLPGIVLSAALLLIVAAALPATVGGMLMVAYAVTAVALALGQFETAAVQVLGRARRATEGEDQLLHGLDGWLHSHGASPPALYVARSDVGRSAAGPCGRRSVVVAPQLLSWLHREQVRRRWWRQSWRRRPRAYVLGQRDSTWPFGCSPRPVLSLPRGP